MAKILSKKFSIELNGLIKYFIDSESNTVNELKAVQETLSKWSDILKSEIEIKQFKGNK